MKWIMFFLNSADNIKYVTSEMQKPSIMSYKRFILYISTFLPRDPLVLKNKINTYFTIILYTDTHEWEIIKPEFKKDDLTFENLIKLNKDKVTTNKKAESEDSMLDIAKKRLFKLYGRNKDRKYKI